MADCELILCGQQSVPRTNRADTFWADMHRRGEVPKQQLHPKQNNNIPNHHYQSSIISIIVIIIINHYDHQYHHSPYTHPFSFVFIEPYTTHDFEFTLHALEEK